MDAGVAAILGAVVGALGTGGAAFVTGLWTAKTTQRQLAAQDAQLHRQLSIEHVRERREPRSKAYADFLAQARVLEVALGRYREMHTLDMEEFHQELHHLDYLGVQVWLEGPPSVLASAQELMKCAHHCIRPLRHSIAAHQRFSEGASEYADAKGHVADMGLEFTATMKSFADAARRALNGEADAPLPDRS
ncbi:hypothetical protein [Streptomyces winkii]|uniref:hypothetical protein n=1 Tax=Streptomyces winkii TaxID=3051178 RepID=UPI0028D2111D|nr:hypothetical protein [Streptomyces sp. DSM 40971]